MAIPVLLLLFLSNCARCSVKVTAATSDNQNIPFGSKHHYVAVEGPLILNCTSWKDTLSSHDLCWRHNSKAWLIDRTTRLDSRTVQLYFPKVTYANNGTYQCCICNVTLPSGIANCAQADVVFIGEKPDVKNLGAKFRPYGCPPVLMELSWKAVPSNGELLEYNVSYQMGSRCPLHMKRASWCTRHSPLSDGSFSCDLKRTVNRSNRRVCTDHHYPLCWKISVTNRFGTASPRPVFQRLKIDTLCPRPRNVKLMVSARGEITVEVDPLENLIFNYVVTYKVKYCYLGTGFTAKEAEELSGRKKQSAGPSNSCELQTSSAQHAFAHVKIKLLSLRDYSQYAMSVSCNLVNGMPYYGLVAGPYNITTLEQAPIEPLNSLWTRPLTSCGDNRTVAVRFKLPPVTAMHGRPSRFVVQYWQTGNKTRMNKTFPTSVRLLMASSGAVSVNITVECNKEYEVRVMMCTVACGGWSSIISVSAEEHPWTSQIKDANQSGNWKVAVIAGVVVGLSFVGLFLFLYIYCRRRRRSLPHQEPLDYRTSDIVPTSDDRLNRLPMTVSTDEYVQSPVPDNDSRRLLGSSSSCDTELSTFDTQDENNKLAVKV